LATAIAVYLILGHFAGYTTAISLTMGTRPDRTQRFGQWLLQAGSDLTPLRFWSGSVGLGLGALALITTLTSAWWMALMPALGVAYLPFWYYSRRRSERLGQIREAWPDALRDALASILTGSTLTSALCDLADRGPVPLQPAFARFRLMSRMMGVVPALELVKEELGDPNSDRVIEVLALAYEHGGGLVSEVLQDLISENAEDLRLGDEIRADGTEQRIESWAVVLVPWIMLAFLTQSSEQYRAFYHSGAGLLVVLAAGVWSLVGVALLGYISRSVPEPRVLVGGRGPVTG